VADQTGKDARDAARFSDARMIRYRGEPVLDNTEGRLAAICG